MFVAILLASGNPGGSNSAAANVSNATLTADIDKPKTGEHPQSQPAPKTIAEASDAEKRFITQNTPDMKNAAAAVGAMINLSGYLCSEVFYVEPLDGGQFYVDCIKHKGRDIKVRYIVDGSTGTVRPL